MIIWRKIIAGGIHMNIVVAGGTGFVGKALVEKLLKHNHKVFILTRKQIESKEEKLRYVKWLTPDSSPEDELHDIDIFINLSGESINSGRWTESRKALIRTSRIEAVEAALHLLGKLKPAAFINASAIGIYGTALDNLFMEDTTVTGNDFLAQTVIQWEKEAGKAVELGIRTVFCRFGIILDRKKGALPKMVFPYRSFIGGNLGNGQQWMSWIHIEDVVDGIQFIMQHKEINGPVNFTAPNPVRMNEFGQTLAAVLNRPHWLPVPRMALRVLLGEMSTLVVDGQKVLPKKLLENGYTFKFPELKGALENLFL